MPAPAIAFIAASLLAASAMAADADAGQRVFKSQCGTCHAVVVGRNATGPSLAGLVGRKAGDVPGFRYSEANKAAGFTWDAARLDTYLADPKAVMPGTSMMYNGLKNDDQRTNLVAYLMTLNPEETR